MSDVRHLTIVRHATFLFQLQHVSSAVHDCPRYATPKQGSPVFCRQMRMMNSAVWQPPCRCSWFRLLAQSHVPALMGGQACLNDRCSPAFQVDAACKHFLTDPLRAARTPLAS